MPQEKTITELYEFLQEHMVTKSEFNDLKKEVKGVKNDVSNIKSEVAGVKNDVSNIKSEVAGVKKDLQAAKLELKDYMDEKSADLRGDLIVLMRKEDHKLLYLIKLLKEKNILRDSDIKKLLRMEPFPKTI